MQPQSDRIFELDMADRIGELADLLNERAGGSKDRPGFANYTIASEYLGRAIQMLLGDIVQPGPGSFSELVETDPISAAATHYGRFDPYSDVSPQTSTVEGDLIKLRDRDSNVIATYKRDGVSLENIGGADRPDLNF